MSNYYNFNFSENKPEPKINYQEEYISFIIFIIKNMMTKNYNQNKNKRNVIYKKNKTNDTYKKIIELVLSFFK